MRKVSVVDRLKYAFDNTMAKGPIALIGWLALASVAIISVLALIVVILQISPGDGEPIGFAEAFWLSLMRTLDAGTMGGDAGWGFRIAMLLVTIGGIFVISTLIGVMTNSVEDKVESLRKGRSRVLEAGHTVILGWSEQVFTIVSELVIANENQRRPCIVIMGDNDKVEMEDELRERVDNTRNTRVVCRTGSPIEMTDLALVSLNTAKSIIILSPDSPSADSQVIKTLLAITNSPDRRPEPYHIVAEIRDLQNMDVARIAGRGEAELVLTGDLIARVTAQTCRQSGLSVIYTELLDFGGDEIYFKSEPSLAGKTFGEVLLSYETSTVIGLQSADGASKLNPPMDTRLKADDRIIAISEDDDTIVLSGRTEFSLNLKALLTPSDRQPKPERSLILGWNWRAPAIARELDNYVSPGSSIMVLADIDAEAAGLDRVRAELKNQMLAFQPGRTKAAAYAFAEAFATAVASLAILRLIAFVCKTPRDF